MGSEAGRDASRDGSADQGRVGGLAEPGRLAGGDHIHDALVAHGDIQDRLAAQRHTARCLAGLGTQQAGRHAEPRGRHHRVRQPRAGQQRQGRPAGRKWAHSKSPGRSGHTASRLAARRTASVTHGGVRLAGGRDRGTGLRSEAPSRVPLY